MDLHSPQIQGFFSIPADQLTGVPALCDHLKQSDLSNTVIVAADVGEAKDAGRFAKRLELPLALIDKRRYGDDENARPAHVIGDIAGKDCLLVDDEVATGGTLFNSTEFLLGHGARSVSAAVVHPVLSGKAPEKLRASRLQRLLVTNTLPIPSQVMSAKLEVLSLAPQLARAMLNIHDGSSVSALFT
jgi:ribose-phosphate pyrophosphokinase